MDKCVLLKNLRGLREQKGEGAVVPFLNNWKI